MNAALRTDWLKIDNVLPAEHLSDSCKVLTLPLHNAEYKTLKVIMQFMLKTPQIILTRTEKFWDSVFRDVTLELPVNEGTIVLRNTGDYLPIETV